MQVRAFERYIPLISDEFGKIHLQDMMTTYCIHNNLCNKVNEPRQN